MSSNANSDEGVAILKSMGFSDTDSQNALQLHGQNVEHAINFLLAGGAPGIGGDNPPTESSFASGASTTTTTTAVHSDVSQYTVPSGRSACTCIALAMAESFLIAADAAADTGGEGDRANNVVSKEFLAAAVHKGVDVYRSVSGSGGDNGGGGVEHSSVEEVLNAAARPFASLKGLSGSPRQGLLEAATSEIGPMGIHAVMSGCRSDAAVDAEKYVAVVITKPPETVLVLLPPPTRASGTASFVLIDSHPRSNQLSPHFPSGSYAILHPTLESLVDSLKQLFPAVDLGSDVNEMMAMMYNSFDAYPFQIGKVK